MDVPDARQDALVEHGHLDGAAAAREDPGQATRVDPVLERVRPEERGMSVVSEPEDAESAGRAGTEFWGPVYPVSPGDEETQGNV